MVQASQLILNVSFNFKINADKLQEAGVELLLYVALSKLLGTFLGST